MSDAHSSNEFLPDIIVPKKSRTPRFRPKITLALNVLPEKCSICSNAAVGFHYDVASCNGCKAFFRRTLITGRRYKCIYNKKCMNLSDQPSTSTKRTCGACRFEKCVEMGMNPISIQSDLLSNEGKVMKEEILTRRRGSSETVEKHGPSVEDEFSRMIEKLKLAEDQMNLLHHENFPEDYNDFRSLLDILNSTPMFKPIKRENLNYHPNRLYAGHGGIAHYLLLSIVEHAKLLDFFNFLSTESVRKVINQGALICRNMITCYQSMKTFNSDIVRRADGTVCGKPMRNYNGVWVDHRKIIQKTLHAFLRNELDYVEYLLLKVIVLCNPAIPGLPAGDQKVLENERIRHARCLFAYCLQQHGKLHGPNRYASVLAIVPIMEMQQQEEKSFNVVIRAFHNVTHIFNSPLYDEIMDSSG